MFLEIEAGLTVLAVVLALTVPKLGSRWFEAIEQSFGRLAKRQGLSVIVVGLTALALRAALLPIMPIPAPGVHDEFGYLLLSDTFAHGRLTNPTNPMWIHFESFHILWQPTYTAKYFPAQGLIMALGQVLTGQPFWGVWLSVGLMCAAITWMLQGWLEPGWALLGGFLAVIRFGTFNYWANSYWGGAVAAIGGALVLGALPRLKQEQRVRYALLMGLGFAILGNSRPYEGLFFGIPVAATMLVWLWKMKRAELKHALKHVMVPLLTVIVLTLVAMGYYFWRTTGTPFNTPYLVYEHTYNPVPYFPWQSVRPFPHYHYDEFRRYYENVALGDYDSVRTVAGTAVITVARLALMGSFFLGPVLTLPLLLLPLGLPYGFSWRDISSKTRFLLAVCGAVVFANMLPICYSPHYTAPVTCVILALVLIAMRSVHRWHWHGGSMGPFLTRAVPSICVLLLGLRAAAGPLRELGLVPRQPLQVPTWCWQTGTNPNRAAILARLRRDAGKQLVIVHYNSHHDPLREWVYNRANINTAKVIWAHDMGPAQNEQLIHYFKHRHVWLVYADDHPPKLLPYSEAADRETWSAGKKGP